MAILKTANTKGKYYESHAKEDVISYILKPNKAKKYYGAYGVNINTPAESIVPCHHSFFKTYFHKIPTST